MKVTLQVRLKCGLCIVLYRGMGLRQSLTSRPDMKRQW